MDERAASLPLQQLETQRDEETRRIWNTNPRTNWMSKIPIGGTEEKEATEMIKKRWAEQGIWKNKWDEMAARRYVDVGRWKHEEPLELESESETDTEAESPPPAFSNFGVPQVRPQPKSRGPKSNDEKQRVAERRAISKERERIRDESANGEGADAADINTRAYENVKNTWTKREIWNGRWGILPGMSWKREVPLEEEATDDPAFVPANPLVNGSHDDRDAPTRRIFGSPSPVTSNHRQTSGIMKNGGTERSPSASNLPRPRTGKRVLHPTTGRALRPSRKLPSHKDGQPQPVASASLGLVHLSKGIKSHWKEKAWTSARRLNASQEVSSGDPPRCYLAQILLDHYPRLLAYPHEEANG
ncbi:MAG: hypothetical protein M1813_008630 [Trichoglossum hirsutum]|nr:MAG: hypothetical protein M1813_008630 [Trichoglossum hirsutum]